MKEKRGYDIVSFYKKKSKKSKLNEKATKIEKTPPKFKEAALQPRDSKRGEQAEKVRSKRITKNRDS
jgi:hypothetical protein